MAANGNHGDRHVTVFEEQEGISATVDQIESTLTIASKLLETPAEELGVMPPSRNIVIRSPSGTILWNFTLSTMPEARPRMTTYPGLRMINT